MAAPCPPAAPPGACAPTPAALAVETLPPGSAAEFAELAAWVDRCRDEVARGLLLPAAALDQPASPYAAAHDRRLEQLRRRLLAGIGLPSV